jgi:hypothetical protein
LGSLRVTRARRILSRHPWHPRAARYAIAAVGHNRQPALVLSEDDSNPEVVLSLSTTVFRYGRLNTGTNGVVLVVFGGRRWAFAAPPDRSIIVVVKKPRIPWWRNRLRRIAMEHSDGT